MNTDEKNSNEAKAITNIKVTIIRNMTFRRLPDMYQKIYKKTVASTYTDKWAQKVSLNHHLFIYQTTPYHIS
jgi:hypothetical protein